MYVPTYFSFTQHPICGDISRESSKHQQIAIMHVHFFSHYSNNLLHSQLIVNSET